MLARIFGSRAPGAAEASWDTGPARHAIKRRQLPIAELPTRDEVLDTAYRYWHSKRHDNLLPSRGDIDILEVSRIIRHTHLVDVSDEDPNRWRFRLTGSVVPQTWPWGIGRDKLSECPWEPYRQMLLQDYGAVKFTGAPMYHEIAARIDWAALNYARVVMPLAEDGRTVDNLMSCVVLRDTPGLSL